MYKRTKSYNKGGTVKMARMMNKGGKVKTPMMMKKGGIARGGGAAISGTGFKGVY